MNRNINNIVKVKAMKQLKTVKCEFCGRVFQTFNYTQRFCCKKCGKFSHNERAMKERESRASYDFELDMSTWEWKAKNDTT